MQTPYQSWDIVIRLGHWLMASLFLVNYWLLEEGEDWHEWAGYALFCILTFRMIWGFVGPSNARFSDFFPTIKRLKYSINNFNQEQKKHLTENRHNPIAGLMVLFLLFTLLITAVSGWMQTLDAFWGEDWVQNLHAWSADAVMIAVVVHVSAVLIIQYRYKVPLIKHMIRR
ncbi:cytochrome b/b6 domain-containing protein [Thalassolituus oleivorans]|jgi:cytochrome b|uniref:cytochrome b/b6 domain-containing protein n=1 Tax=Thalassolituus oleivorans TaxID=187493 RepID=UPI00042DC1FA|nr:cytochrome b/b6 domain-containing protein [Thalassolituus oleivorans]AHK16281.1 cytochrome B561 [Thalassolituus oleivorans R6-15]